MGRRATARRGVGHTALFAGLLLLATAVVAGVATGDEPAGLPDEFTATGAAAGLSFVQLKQPNPLPVGPGAFATFEVPEAAGELTASTSTARTSLVYPGPVLAGLPALLCTAGASPFCGQAPPPVLVEAENPQKPDATLATDGFSFRQPGVPLRAGAGSGEAHVTGTSSTSTAELGSYRVAAPDPARQAILDALASTLGQLPGAKVAVDDALFSVAGGSVVQKIAPIGGGALRTEATARVNGVHLLAGAVTIDSVTVTAFAVTDGDSVRDAGSRTTTNGVLVGGFPATIGPDGIAINGSGDDGAGRTQLNGVAGKVADAVHVATGKLRLEVRDGSATKQADGGGAAADGLRISLSSQQLTDTSPPQVSALCTVTGAVQDPLSSNGLSLPPVCAVPDLTGTTDSYTFLLGSASVSLVAQRFPGLDLGIDGGTGSGGVGLGGVAGAGGSLDAGSIGDLGGGGAAGGAGSSTGSAGRARSVLDPKSPGFLQLEAKWLGGSRAADRFGDVYLALAGFATLLLLASRVLLRATRTDFRREAP